jgi:hypothetical protein
MFGPGVYWRARVSRKVAKFAKGEWRASGWPRNDTDDHGIGGGGSRPRNDTEDHGNGERGLRPRNDTEDHGNGERMIGCSGLAFIGARGFHAKTLSSQRGTGARRVGHGMTRKITEMGKGVCGHGMTRKITEMGKG